MCLYCEHATGSEKLGCYCLLPLFSILQQVAIKHDIQNKYMHTQPPEEKHTLM